MDVTKRNFIVGLSAISAGSVAATLTPSAGRALNLSVTVTPAAPSNYMLDYNFDTGSYKAANADLGAVGNAITVTRSGTNATDLLADDALRVSFNSYAANAPRFNRNGLLAERQVTQLAATAQAPANETINVTGTGIHILWINGSGSVTVAAGTAIGTGFGTAMVGSPVFVNITTIGTVTITVTGSVSRYQFERSVMATSFITSGTRAHENVRVAAAPLANITLPCTILTEFELPQKSQNISSGRTLFTIYQDASNYIQGNLVFQSYGPTVSVIVRIGGVNVVNVTNIVGYISTPGKYRAAFRMESGKVSMQNSGNPSATLDATAFTYPTVANAYIANFAGTSAHLNGMVRKFLVAPPMTDAQITEWMQGLDRSRFIGCWGDSLTDSSGASGLNTRWPAVLASKFATQPQVFNGGIGGQDYSQIAARQAVDTQYIDGVNTFWGGRNNTLDQPMTLTAIANMVAKQKSGKFVVMTITTHTNGDEDGAGSSIGNAIRAQNAAILAAYPNNSIDILSLMIAASGGNRHIDSSWGAGGADVTHFNDTAYAFIGQTVYNFITGKGWIS